ncbi:acetyl-CoA carboxylase biotin carboxyl carrier protein [Bacillus sp. 2205SS5-2]|uniref:acetyl-CoA carboxylase biotin carboxyl carrier protein n=1 Tax=Bacillus sp. 2205SS5-2 TaxID=3109031 RepID=UPI003006FC2E
MLKVQEIRELIKLIDNSSIDEFVYEYEGSKVKMKKGIGSTVRVPEVVSEISKAPVNEELPKAIAAVSAEVSNETKSKQTEKNLDEANENLHKITSPMVGTFYQSPSPEADNYVKVGDRVSKESVVCIVEAMKLFNEIEAEISGEIVEILAEDGQLVEYGQPLFLVKI